MTIRSLPVAPEARPRTGISCEVRPSALERWNPGIQAAASDENSISIFDPIGADWAGEGVTAKRIAGALRAIGGKDVTVNVNSPGGDMFEGLAIYNLLRDYKGTVTVKVLGVAASAASVIVMAGDEIQMARASFLMIHNAWVMAIGNRHDLREFADTLEPFDKAMADIYAARTGTELKKVQKMMDAETWIGGAEAVESGWADALLPADEVKKSDARADHQTAVRSMDNALAKAGMPRSERKRLISELKSGTPGAAEGTPGAADVAEKTLADFRTALAELEFSAVIRR